VPVNVVEAPLQIATFEPALMVGNADTVTVTFAVLEQEPLVPVIVYVVVEAGEAVTLAPVDADKEPAGAHV
jgi:hypothetical protein